MNLSEKLDMARQLDALGVDVIEAGFAIVSPEDSKSVEAIAKQSKTAPWPAWPAVPREISTPPGTP